LLVNGQELLGELFQQLVSRRWVNVDEPFLVLSRKWDFVVGPFASLKRKTRVLQDELKKGKQLQTLLNIPRD
jgi:hypothetical protein